MVAKRCFQNVIGIRTILDFPGRGAFSLLAQDSPIAAQNSLSWFFPAGNLDGDSVPHSHGTRKITDFGYLASTKVVAADRLRLVGICFANKFEGSFYLWAEEKSASR